MTRRGATRLGLALFAVLAVAGESFAANVRQVAARSVVAVSLPGEPATGFAFGAKGIIVSASRAEDPPDGRVTVVAASGQSEGAEPGTREGRVLTLSAPDLPVVALRAEKNAPKEGDRVRVLGPPVGYQGRRILREQLVRAGKGLGFDKELDARFLGAPIVTRAGRVVGMVSDVRKGAPMTTVASISALLEVEPSPGDNGVPLWIWLVVALVLIVALAAVAWWRRRRAQAIPAAPAAQADPPDPDPSAADTTVPAAPAPPGPPTVPLVRLRQSDDQPDDDFQIVFRGRENDEDEA